MRTRDGGSTVLLADDAAATTLAESLPADEPVIRYDSVREMVEEQPLSSISVLVIRPGSGSLGPLLATLGRMSLEFPAMQKVAVLDRPPSLALAGYLTACGVELLGGDAPGKDAVELASVVHRMHERAQWPAL